MPGSIPASTACEPTPIASSIAATCDRMIREKMPNLLRLYINPAVAQACYCLTRLIAEAWPGLVDADQYQVFLANSGEEALSGAIKLARYAANAEGTSGTGLILDEDGRIEHFASTELAGHGRLQFIPGIEVVGDPGTVADRLADPKSPVGFVVLPHDVLRWPHSPLTADFKVSPAARQPLLIVCTDQHQIITQPSPEHSTRNEFPGRAVPTTTAGSGGHRPLDGSEEQRAVHQHVENRAPDIVVFDDSFVNREVPFGAFAAKKRLFWHWNRRGMTTFHSTTYQPNTISTLHFVNSLRANIPEFIARHQAALQRIDVDPKFRYDMFRDLYSRSLAKLASAAGVEDADVHASGHYVLAAGKRIFDGVAGVACSIRGHNPPTYVEELRQTGDCESARDELVERLADLTGLPQMVPAVSGAAAVEQALKLGLASQFPRDWVLALRGGFGGKTLFALTGTWKSTLKTGLTPLYPHVVYVDPFAVDALAAVDAAFRDHPIGVVQLELIQGVGGVRAVPAAVVQRLTELRRKTDCLLFVDEIQTGMFRTGPFVRSNQLGIQPDLLTIGKGTSDMMFPFAVTLYSEAVQERLVERACLLPDAIRARTDMRPAYRRFSILCGVQTMSIFPIGFASGPSSLNDC